jgi:tRNA(adenine34) deaminase
MVGSRVDYPDLATEAARMVMLELVRILGEYKDSMAIVGGWVPELLFAIARGDGRIIARGHNEQNSSQNKIAHAEMVAFDRTPGQVPIDARDLILVSTLEPCVMCLGACMEAAVDTVIYGLSAPADGGRLRVRPPMSPENQMPRILSGVLAEQYRDLLRLFLKKPSSDPLQIGFVNELLSHAPSSLVGVQTPLLTG